MNRITRSLTACVFLATLFVYPPSALADADALRAMLTGPSRPEADKIRDAGRRPADVVTFLGIGTGATVLDLVAASGYYTEVLATAVGPSGKVYAQNSDFMLQMRDGAVDRALSERLAGDRLPNVVRLDRSVGDLGLEPGSLDAAFTALNFHDIYNGRGRPAAETFLLTVYGLLKKGGLLGLIDHQGSAENDNAALHRVERAQVLEIIEASPFQLENESDLLRNPKDDHTQGVFHPSVRGKTDRFLLLLRKPLGN